jgi:23S rRNA A2030 N6-methylase RlmJ
MDAELAGWTYIADDGKSFCVEKFTDQGRGAFDLILQISDRVREAQREINRLQKQIEIDDEALRLVNGIVSQQLTNEMLVED